MQFTPEGKLILRVNASSLKQSTCMLNWTNTILHGYYTGSTSAAANYGVAIHKYIDTMFKTGGNMKFAREHMLKAFRVPKYFSYRGEWLGDENHLTVTAYNYWDDYVTKDTSFEHLQLNSRCWYCDGEGVIKPEKPEQVAATEVEILYPKCEHCNGTGMRLQVATEVTFSVKFYEDEFCVIYLEGTQDKVGRIKGGAFCVGDYKSTSEWKIDEFLSDFEMSNQLRFYRLPYILMAEQQPDSILGQIGATRMGCFIDGIFLNPKISEVKYKRSAVYMFTDEEMAEFRRLLTSLCYRLSHAAERIVKNKETLEKEGLLNGSCKGKYKCSYWKACKAGSMYQQVLDSEFKKKEYNPLKHNEL